MSNQERIEFLKWYQGILRGHANFVLDEMVAKRKLTESNQVDSYENMFKEYCELKDRIRSLDHDIAYFSSEESDT